MLVFRHSELGVILFVWLAGWFCLCVCFFICWLILILSLGFVSCFGSTIEEKEERKGGGRQGHEFKAEKLALLHCQSFLFVPFAELSSWNS